MGARALALALALAAVAASGGCGMDRAVELEAVKLRDIDRSGVLAPPLVPGSTVRERFGVSGAYGGLTTLHVVEQVPAGVRPRAAFPAAVATLQRRGVRSDSRPECEDPASWTGTISVPSSWPGITAWVTRVTVEFVDRTGESVGQVASPYVSMSQNVALGTAEANPLSGDSELSCLIPQPNR